MPPYQEPKPAFIPNEVLQQRQRMINEIRSYLKGKPWNKIEWSEFYKAQESLGYPLTGFEREMRGKW